MVLLKKCKFTHEICVRYKAVAEENVISEETSLTMKKIGC
jgi:hypothetical protein